jgi:hypothetical protein
MKDLPGAAFCHRIRTIPARGEGQPSRSASRISHDPTARGRPLQCLPQNSRQEPPTGMAAGPAGLRLTLQRLVLDSTGIWFWRFGHRPA